MTMGYMLAHDAQCHKIWGAPVKMGIPVRSHFPSKLGIPLEKWGPLLPPLHNFPMSVPYPNLGLSILKLSYESGKKPVAISS